MNDTNKRTQLVFTIVLFALFVTVIVLGTVVQAARQDARNGAQQTIANRNAGLCNRALSEAIGGLPPEVANVAQRPEPLRDEIPALVSNFRPLTTYQLQLGAQRECLTLTALGDKTVAAQNVIAALCSPTAIAPAVVPSAPVAAK